MIETILSLDLEYLEKRLIKQLNWNSNKAKESVRKYKNFLILHFLYPEFLLVPTRVIDSVWHEHILHTKKYMDDCLLFFGEIFHHYPTLPTEKAEKEEAEKNFMETVRLYERYFNEPYGKAYDISIWL